MHRTRKKRSRRAGEKKLKKKMLTHSSDEGTTGDAGEMMMKRQNKCPRTQKGALDLKTFAASKRPLVH